MSLSVQQYFEACVWEATNRAAQLVPPVNAFVPMRRYAGGMWMYYDFLELVQGESLPLLARQDTAIRRLLKIVGNVACWTNDLYSAAKEIRRGDVHNLIVVLSQQKGLSLEEAVAEAVEYCNAEVHEFIATETRLPDHLRRMESVVRYVQALKAIMRGNLDWSIRSGRYSGELPSELSGVMQSYVASLRPGTDRRQSIASDGR
jgi:5-epi-alpha-selinene synthase